MSRNEAFRFAMVFTAVWAGLGYLAGEAAELMFGEFSYSGLGGEVIVMFGVFMVACVLVPHGLKKKYE